MCINFSSSIYGNSRLETNRGLALRWSGAYDSRPMGSEILHQGQGNSLRYLHLQLIQGIASCLFSLMSDRVLHVPGPLLYLCSIPPIFGKNSVEEETDMVAGWTLVALPFISGSLLPHIRNAGSEPVLAGFVIVLGEANLTLPMLLRRFVQVLNGLIIVAGCSLPWLLLQSSALLSSLCVGSI